jgi:phage pi2 protein 07
VFAQGRKVVNNLSVYNQGFVYFAQPKKPKWVFSKKPSLKKTEKTHEKTHEKTQPLKSTESYKNALFHCKKFI